MKRFVILLICCAACLGLLAAPALAGKKAQTDRLPQNASMSWDGTWFVYSPSTGYCWDEVTWYQADDPAATWLEFKPVPKDRPIFLFAMWIGVGYLYMDRWIPDAVLFTYDVTYPNGHTRHYGPKQVKTDWTGPYVWDAWWDYFLGTDEGTFAPLNPHATTYGNNVLLPIGPFRCAGKYTVTESWWTAKPTVDRFAPGPAVYHAAGAESGGITYNLWVE
jgi:hypothetical protein